MLRKVMIALTAILCLLNIPLSAQQNNYRCVDRSLQKVYKQVTGVSLKDAIDQLIAEKRGGRLGNSNIVVRFNGGGSQNRLFIGQNNTLEFLVTNDWYIQAASLGFEFSCTAGPGSFGWVPGYGDCTAGDSTIIDAIKFHTDGFGIYGPWDPDIGTLGYPDTLILGGVAFMSGGSYPLEPNSDLTPLYSMQINIPNDPAMVGDTFYIDNIFIPPAAYWIFTEVPPGVDYPPDFQGIANSSTGNPTAPPVAFPITDPRCDYIAKSSNPNLIYIPDDSLERDDSPIDIREYINRKNDDKIYLSVIIIFEGDNSALEKLGIKIDLQLRNKILADIPIDKLPALSQVNGILHIKPQQSATLELNYSTPDVDCRYAINQDSLGVSGNSVILGIIDTGIDWLHEDFIDSNGNTRIKYFWDQSDPTGPHPTNPYFNRGTELTFSDINQFVHLSNPQFSDSGRDYNGHGTHVTGIAAGNNRSGGSQDFVSWLR